jgi:hypothetical protein
MDPALSFENDKEGVHLREGTGGTYKKSLQVLLVRPSKCLDARDLAHEVLSIVLHHCLLLDSWCGQFLFPCFRFFYRCRQANENLCWFIGSCLLGTFRSPN